MKQNNYLNWSVRKYVQNDLKKMGIPAREISQYITFIEDGQWVRPFWYITKVCINYVNTLLADHDIKLVCDSDRIYVQPLNPKNNDSEKV